MIASKMEIGTIHSSSRGSRLSALRLLCLIAISLLIPACSSKNPVVTVYTSQDQVYAEKILADFSRGTGVDVRSVFDSEAVKTVGIANRLLAEKHHPNCDLFWNNEELRTRQLASMGVFRETNGWATFGYRSRRIVINTNLVPLVDAPRTFRELTNSVWRGKVALAYPLFGTTATHFMALRQAWGPVEWERWCVALQNNKPFLVDGNSVVVNLVGRGEAWVGMTDSDDIAAGRREGLPIVALSLNSDSLLVPNSVGLVRGGPRRSEGDRLFAYLQSPAVVDQLIIANALEGKDGKEITIKTLNVDWNELLQDLEPATARLKAIFLR